MTVVKLGWAMGKSQVLKHISEVSRGAACDCVCPDCGAPVIAKQGEKTSWHFAHKAETNCLGESALHLAGKQQLARAVQLGVSIRLPQIIGSVEAYDISSKKHEGSWNFTPGRYRPNSYQDEARLENGIIADALLNSDDERTLAVEIYVTHRKSEEDAHRYAMVGIDSVEIDLSQMAWDADPTTVFEQVTEVAPRTWVYASRDDELRVGAERSLAEDLERINREINSKVGEKAETFDIAKLSDAKYAKWPIIRKYVRARDSFGEAIVGAHQEAPQVTSIEQELHSVNGIWKTHGLVNFRTSVDIIFHHAAMDVSEYLSGRATLGVGIFLDDEGPFWDSEEVSLRWYDIERWEERVLQRAKGQLQSKTRESRELKDSLERYAERFQALSNMEKLQQLSSEIGLTEATYLGSLHDGWNTTWSIWKTLVWRYKIFTSDARKVNVHNVATDGWLQKLTGFSEDYEMEEERCKSLWFWFKDLERIGFLRHTGKQWFEVTEDLPAGFKPWEKIPRT